jgi:hypothetical protein
VGVAGRATRPRRLLVTAAALVLSVAVACGDDGSDVDDEGLSPPASPTPQTAPPAPGVSAPGTGSVAVGGAVATFEVTECRTEADPAEPEAAQTLVAVAGSGTTDSGVDFTVEIARFATGTEVRTFTDSIIYSDPARILQAQRIEVAGEVTDLRDQRATSALLTVRPDGVSGRGLAGPPGSTAEDEGITGIAVDATCG